MRNHNIHPQARFSTSSCPYCYCVFILLYCIQDLDAEQCVLHIFLKQGPSLQRLMSWSKYQTPTKATTTSTEPLTSQRAPATGAIPATETPPIDIPMLMRTISDITRTYSDPGFFPPVLTDSPVVSPQETPASTPSSPNLGPASIPSSPFVGMHNTPTRRPTLVTCLWFIPCKLHA